MDSREFGKILQGVVSDVAQERAEKKVERRELEIELIDENGSLSQGRLDVGRGLAWLPTGKVEGVRFYLVKTDENPPKHVVTFFATPEEARKVATWLVGSADEHDQYLAAEAKRTEG